MKAYSLAVVAFSIVFVAIGIASRALAAAGRWSGFLLGGLFVALGAVDPGAQAPWPVSSRGFERVLDAPALFAVAYGEIASSLYIALGIVAAAALGLTPLVLLLTGALFLVVSLSYAEGTAALPEAGGAATSCGRAFNDLAGFVDRMGPLPRLPDRARARRSPCTTSPRRSRRRRCATTPGTL